MQLNIPGLSSAVEGITANGVPYVAAAPQNPADARGLILLWHGADPPRSEAALASALPLVDLNCWRVYLGMPLYGRRSPSGGFSEIMQLGAQDAVNLIFKPSILGAVAEFAGALNDIRRTFAIDAGLPLGLFGFSQGGAAALLTIDQADFPFKAVATYGAVVDLRALVDILSARYATPYDWTPERIATAESMSSMERAKSLASSSAALLLAVGGDDDLALIEPSRNLAASIRSSGGTAEVAVVPGVPHAFVEAPGEEAAPQGPMAGAIEVLVSDWFSRHLT